MLSLMLGVIRFVKNWENKMVDVKGKWAFITGAARGIGYLSAKFMAERGCNLILHSRDANHTK